MIGSARPAVTLGAPPLVSVLETADDVAAAEREASGLARPPVRAKYWDNLLALRALEGLEREPIADLGCRSGVLLTWLHQRAFRELWGCDLRSPWPPVKSQLVRRDLRGAVAGARMFVRHRSRMRRAPMESTPFLGGGFAAVASMSAIEHGVDRGAFLRECHRLLRPGGLLVLSTDYWPEPVTAEGERWNERGDMVFDRAGIDALFELARGIGFLVPSDIPDAVDRVVRWEGRAYTFLFAVLVRE